MAHASDPEHVGRRLRAVRAASGLSQSQFAAKAGVSASALANWEQGRQRPRPPQVESICDAFQLTSDYLILGKIGTLRKDVAEPIEQAERMLSTASTDNPE